MLAYEMNKQMKMVLAEKEQPQKTTNNLIVKIKKTSICGTDVRTYVKGSNKIVVPRTLGHEFSGKIIHIGEDVKTDFSLNDRVVLAPAIGCGECWPCLSGHTNMCDNLQTIGFTYEGSFTEYIEIPEQALKMGNLLKLPDNVEYDEASLVEPIGCVLNAQKYVNIEEGDYVVVYGAGFIGCLHAELAKLKGAAKVIIVEPAKERGQQAVKFIPDILWIDPVNENTVKRVRDITNNRGANVVIVANSVPSCQVEAQKIAAKMGRISLFGGLVGESIGFIDSNEIHYKELQVSGVHATTPEMMKEILTMVSEKQLNIKKYINKTLPLSDIEKGFESILKENVMKVVITP